MSQKKGLLRQDRGKGRNCRPKPCGITAQMISSQKYFLLRHDGRLGMRGELLPPTLPHRARPANLGDVFSKKAKYVIARKAEKAITDSYIRLAIKKSFTGYYRGSLVKKKRAEQHQPSPLKHRKEIYTTFR